MKFFNTWLVATLISMQFLAPLKPAFAQEDDEGSVFNQQQPQQQKPAAKTPAATGAPQASEGSGALGTFLLQMMVDPDMRDAVGRKIEKAFLRGQLLIDESYGTSAIRSVYLVERGVKHFEPAVQDDILNEKIASIEVRFFPAAQDAAAAGDDGQLFVEVIRHSNLCKTEAQKQTPKCKEYANIGYQDLKAKFPKEYKGHGITYDDYQATMGKLNMSLDTIWKNSGLLKIRKLGSGALTAGSCIAILFLLGKINKVIDKMIGEEAGKALAEKGNQVRGLLKKGIEKLTEGLGKLVRKSEWATDFLKAASALSQTFVDSHLNKNKGMLMMALMIEMHYITDGYNEWDHLLEGIKGDEYAERIFLHKALTQAYGFAMSGEPMNQATFVDGKAWAMWQRDVDATPESNGPMAAENQSSFQEEQFTDEQEIELMKHQLDAKGMKFINLGMALNLDQAWKAFKKLNRIPTDKDGGYLVPAGL